MRRFRIEVKANFKKNMGAFATKSMGKSIKGILPIASLFGGTMLRIKKPNKFGGSVLRPKVKIYLIFGIATTALAAGCIFGRGAIHSLIAPKKLTVQDIRNATFTFKCKGYLDQVIQLKNGTFSGKNPYAKDYHDILPSLAMSDKIAFGDIDHSGNDGAVVVLSEGSGGSESLTALAAVLNKKGKPTHVATFEIEDRAIVQSIKVNNGIIYAEILRHGPDDALCCPSLLVNESYRYIDMKIVPCEDIEKAKEAAIARAESMEKEAVRAALGEEIQVKRLLKKPDPIINFKDFDKSVLHNLKLFINRKTGVLTLNFSGNNIIFNELGSQYAVSAEMHFKCMDSLGKEIVAFETEEHWTFSKKQDTFYTYTQYQEAGNTASAHLSRMESDYIDHAEICFNYLIVEVGP